MPLSSRISRRNFLAASAAVACTVPDLAAQAPSGLAAQTPSGGQVPPAIAALSNLSGQARPFTSPERQARIERARQLMGQNRVDAIVLANSTSSSVYFADLRLYGGERLWALVLPEKTKPFLVCPAFEEGRAHGLLAVGPLADCDVLTWQEDESPYVLLGKGLADRGLTSATVGIDEHMAFVFSVGIGSSKQKLNVVSATPITAGCRMIKSAHEIECMRLACRATLLVYRAVEESLHPGMATADVHALIAAAYHRVGFEGEASLNIDEFTALPHGSRQMQTLREGSILMLDDGCSVEGYQSDITRTFVLGGKPTDKMKSVFDLVQRAQTAALRAARPGVPAGDVDAAARKIIVDGGYGPGFKFFTHRVGHGIGLDGHEWPYFVRNNMFGWDLNPKLQEGMTLSDEPGIYIPGEFGIRLEDDLLVSEGGAELLTPQCPSLEDPFANVS